MESLKQRLSQEREQVKDSLGKEQRAVLEKGGGYGGGGQETIEIMRKLDDGLWKALLDLAGEVDRLKG